MHAILCPSRGHVLEIIKKIRDWQLYYIYCTVYKLAGELNCFQLHSEDKQVSSLGAQDRSLQLWRAVQVSVFCKLLA